MLQLFCSIVDCTVKQSRTKLACYELRHRLSMAALSFCAAEKPCYNYFVAY